MPVLPSSYLSPRVFRNGHVQTIYPTLLRRAPEINYERARITTPDNDFLDLDRVSIGSNRVSVVLHGLEGSTSRPYIRGMAAALARSGWDVFAWNFRGCSGEPNRTPRFYHMGDTEDIDTVIRHVLMNHRYETITLVGFSMGGNVILKYLAEQGERLPPPIRAAAAFSVPCDLPAAAEKMDRPSNAIYTMRFLVMLEEKIRAKAERFPGLIDDRPVRRMRTFREFDEVYTARIHGFASADDYWARSASKPLLRTIPIPTLLVNALDDPFLTPSCYPYEEARANPNFFLETPPHGGHVGFVSFSREGLYWSEERAVAFLGLHAGDNDPRLPE